MKPKHSMMETSAFDNHQNATYGTGHLHIGSVACSEHGHHQNYKINLRLHLAMASAKSVY